MTRKVSGRISDLRALQRATLNARRRLGDPRIGTCLEDGRFSVVRVTYAGTSSTVETIREELTVTEAVDALDGLRKEDLP